MQGNGFAGVLDDEGAIGDFGLQDSPGAFEEQESVVIRGSAGIQVERVAGAGSAIDQVLGLGGANGDAVKGYVVVHRIGASDQAVVRDHFHAGFAGFFNGGGGSVTILRADDNDFDAFGDQSFNVGFLFGRIALAEENFDVVTGGGQGILEAGFVLDPARFVFGREYDTDGQFTSASFFSGGSSGATRCQDG